ncbi:MAG: hypothetical protein AAGE84_31500 [Cyanobacteria bacterium P01_G01_bin.39]
MQKPWSFKAIKFLNYFQIGLALIVSSYGILLLIAREVQTVGQPSFARWTWLVGLLLGWKEKNVESPDFILGVALSFLFDFIMLSVILYVLKTKSFVVIRATAILTPIIRIAISLGWHLIDPFGAFGTFTIYTFTLIAFPILVVAVLFLKPVQRYIQVRS